MHIGNDFNLCSARMWTYNWKPLVVSAVLLVRSHLCRRMAVLRIASTLPFSDCWKAPGNMLFSCRPTARNVPPTLWIYHHIFFTFWVCWHSATLLTVHVLEQQISHKNMYFFLTFWYTLIFRWYEGTGTEKAGKRVNHIWTNPDVHFQWTTYSEYL